MTERHTKDQRLADRLSTGAGQPNAEERLPGEGVVEADTGGQVGITVREPRPTGENVEVPIREP